MRNVLEGQAFKRRSHVSTGLGTMLLGVSGSWDDKEVTSLPDELPKEPDSEMESCGGVKKKKRNKVGR